MSNLYASADSNLKIYFLLSIQRYFPFPIFCKSYLTEVKQKMTSIPNKLFNFLSKGLRNINIKYFPVIFVRSSGSCPESPQDSPRSGNILLLLPLPPANTLRTAALSGSFSSSPYCKASISFYLHKIELFLTAFLQVRSIMLTPQGKPPPLR